MNGSMFAWVKSSYSGTSSNCVEVANVGTEFHKSSYSASQGDCVEAAAWQAAGAIRDTKHRDLATLTFPQTEWRAFLSAVKDGGL